MPTVKFVNEKKSVEVPQGANLRKEALKNGVNVYWGPHKVFNCHGLGNCGSCKVLVKKGEPNVSRPGWWERFRIAMGPLTFLTKLSHDEAGKELRLACRTRVQGDVEVETHPGINWHGDRFWG
jgi:ferredoxin